MLGHMFGSDIHWGLIYGIIACVLGWILMDHTVFGFATGSLAATSERQTWPGLSIGKISLLACFLGERRRDWPGLWRSPPSGKGQRKSGRRLRLHRHSGRVLARQNPLAIIPVAILLGGIGAAAGLLQRQWTFARCSQPRCFKGIIFVVILGFETFYGRFKIFQRKGVPA